LVITAVDSDSHETAIALNTLDEVIANRFKAVTPDVFMLYPDQVSLAFDLIVSDGCLVESRPDKVLAALEELYPSSNIISEAMQSLRQMSKILK